MARLSRHKHPAYHLRPNKAVDRFIFVEFLRTLELLHPLKDHVYVGFGGPFLEDFRLLAQIFPYLHLISIESDEETYKRQRFHRCSRKMKAIRSDFNDFLATRLPSHVPVILWADYTDMARERLVEAADIARRVANWSVLRITVRAEIPDNDRLHLDRRPPEVLPKKKRAAFQALQERYQYQMAVDGISFDPGWFTWKSFTDEGFPVLLSRMIGAVIAGSCSRPKTFVPLHAVKYSDGTIMLSLTGIFCPNDKKEELLKHFKTFWTFCGYEESTVDAIDVPELTTKERLALDAVLPSHKGDGAACIRKLGYLIEGDNSKDVSTLKMRHYEKYYRLYPYFGKLVP